MFVYVNVGDRRDCYNYILQNCNAIRLMVKFVYFLIHNLYSH